ncbi:uncharacterized protein LOC143023724 [Oratosquilla oratoria]|uniref:uncharacterized protein LOC143023724 n=1 Tax=Oratosquilla oratoria TaxID=337810 RepID=UPI003F76FC5C
MSKFTSIEELEAQAESIALKGDDVGRFVLNQQAFERDERTKEREFERVANLLQVEEDSLAARLGSTLTGKAAELYSTFDLATISNFSLLKQALLTGFDKTPERYRLDFRNDKIRVRENYRQFAIRLRQLFDNWLEACKVPQTFEALRQCVVLDQFLASLIPDIRLFIKEQSVTSLESAVVKADDWASAHKAYPKPNTNYASGTINGSWTSTIVRDTGCNCVLVSEEDADVSLCPKVSVADFLGRVNEFPVVRCYISCPYYEGWVDAVRAPMKCASVLIGNVPGARDPSKHDPFPFKPHASSLDTTTNSTLPTGMQTSIAAAAPITKTVPPPTLTQESTFQINAVETRRSKMKRVHPLQMPALQPLSVTPEEFCSLQESCPTLAGLWDKTKSEEMDQTKNGSSFQYLKIDGLLYRKCVLSTHVEKVGKLALVVPKECRPIILSVGHKNPLAGHFSQRKTAMKIADKFFWPGMALDIRDFCRSCDICQRMSSKGRVRSVPLHPLPIITEPFNRVAIDLVGPLSPPSAEGHRYILTLVDFATGFPGAVPLKEVDSISVAEALLTIFSRVGIPREILSDQGTQFTSQLMAELHKLLGVKPSFTTAFHLSGNGRIERLHGPLKAALRKMCTEKPRDWHRYLVPTLFALREIPSDRTGFSAFELLYGRTVRGPLSVLQDLWEDRSIKDDDHSTFSYVIELQDKLAESAKIAAQNADGPYEVLEKRGKVDYVTDSPTGPKLYQTNLLKKYYRRPSVAFAELLDEPSTIDDSPLHKEICLSEPEDSRLPVTPDGQTDETDSRPNVNPKLEGYQQTSLVELVSEYKEFFSDNPGCTSTVKHDIILTTTDRIHMKVYPVPVHLKPHFESEVESLFQQGIIQRSSSPHCSPVVMVRKSDGSYRMAIDYRQLNAVTVFHAEPVCNIEEDLYKFPGSKYFSELDLCKAYYQVPLWARAKPLTAFPAHLGLMEFCRLPFGLATACAMYNPLMRIVLAGLPNVSFYFDNIFVYSSDWSQHCTALRAVLDRIRSHHLTLKISKCRFGFPAIQYLGFILSGDCLQLQPDKVEALCRVPPPSTKKLLRSFLGMVGFYKMFIPQAADYTGLLSNLLRKTVREPLSWTEELQSLLNHLKLVLSSNPVLRLPDTNLTFVLRTDASNHGLGAVLLQYHLDYPHPVAFASRKLLDRESRYSTIERECLAVVFGIQRFDYYLRGREFVLEVDHKPLTYLHTFKGKNDRLLRWVLSLQAYKFRIVHVAGVDNIGADLLSRA